MNIVLEVTDTPLGFISDRSSEFTKSHAPTFFGSKIASQGLPESFHEDLTLRSAIHRRRLGVVIVDDCAA
jgi:hypothetical protein